MKFGAYLRRERKRASLSLRSLAERIECSAAYLSRVERDEVECVPSEALVCRIALALELDEDELLRRVGRLPSAVKEFLLRNESALRKVRRQMEREAAVG